MAAAMNGMALHGGVHPLWRHLPGLLRLLPAGDPPLGAAAGPGRLRDDPRFDRARRGWADPPADRASRRPAGDPQSRRLPPGRRGRDRGMLGAGARAARRAVAARADPPEPAAAPARAVRGESLRARRLSASRRGRASAGRADRDRLGGPGRARRRRRAGSGRGSAPTSSRCPAGACSTPQDPAYRADMLPGGACSRSRSRPARRWLGALYRPRRAQHRPRPVRRLGAGRAICSSASASPPRRSCRGSLSALESSRRSMIMATRVAINGFGRIGRLVARAMLAEAGQRARAGRDQRPRRRRVQRPAVQARFGPRRLSGRGRAPTATISIIDGRRIHVTAERDPAKLPHGADRDRPRARMHRLLHRSRTRPARISLRARRRC